MELRYMITQSMPSMSATYTGKIQAQTVYAAASLWQQCAPIWHLTTRAEGTLLRQLWYWDHLKRNNFACMAKLILEVFMLFDSINWHSFLSRTFCLQSTVCKVAHVRWHLVCALREFPVWNDKKFHSRQCMCVGDNLLQIMWSQDLSYLVRDTPFFCPRVDHRNERQLVDWTQYPAHTLCQGAQLHLWHAHREVPWLEWPTTVWNCASDHGCCHRKDSYHRVDTSLTQPASPAGDVLLQFCLKVFYMTIWWFASISWVFSA